MRILVTGAAGFIGSHIVDAALAAGHDVAGLDDLSTGRRENVADAAAFFAVDIRGREAVQEVFREFRPDVISHQAAQASVSVSVREAARDAEINVLGTIHLLDAARETGVSRFVFASTGGAIYGEVPAGQKASEDTTPQPLSPYACAKFAAEQYLRAYQAEHGLSTCALRYANVYGPRQDPHGEAGVVAIFARRLIAGQPLTLFARRTKDDDGCVRDYVYVDDVVKANLAALNGEVDLAVMNVGTGIGSTTLQIANLLAKSLDAKAEILFEQRRPGDLECSVLDASACAARLGTPTPLADGLAATAKWFAAQAL